ncbi:MAG: Holliday junction resolvase RuvX [Lachnospirales bacterium]
MGLDYGSKTVGVSLTDPTCTIVRGLEIIERENEESIKKTVKRLGEIIKEYNVETIVLGYPLNMDGSEGERCKKTIEFKERLNRNFKKMPIELWDERLSTIGASRNLYEAGLNSKKQKDIIDKMAAVFILQGYIDKRG